MTVAMSAQTLLLILAAIAFSVTGQLLLKSGAQQLGDLGRLEFLLAAARDVRVLSGLAAWIAWTICWLHVLRAAPLSRAYALTSLAYVLVPLASMCVFGEQVRRLHVAGIVLIAAGIACVLADV
jgi:undecaprenyl phosphate-alpha-L-ara4N flippase subunit ArnE